MLDTGVPQTIDDLLGLLGRRDTGGDTESLDGETLLAHLLPERELESPVVQRSRGRSASIDHLERDESAKSRRNEASEEKDSPLPLVDVEGVKGDSDSGLVDETLNFIDLGAKSLGVVVSSSCELDVVASGENGRDEAGLDGGGGPV